MKTVVRSMLLVSILLISVACNPATSTPSTTQTITGEVKNLEDLLQSGLQRVSFPDVYQLNKEAVVDGNSAFAFDLYQELKKEDSNLFFSPYSISIALAMTYAGARGETEQQMADVLHFNLEQDRLHPAFNWLDGELAKRGEGAEGKDGEGFRLNVVNAIWGQKDYRFLVDFLDTLAENYGAGLRGVDFFNEPERARLTINQWVSQQTEGRIKDILPPGIIDELTRLVLANAIYFNAAWLHTFDENSTEDGPFRLLNGDQVTVPMMKQTEYFNYSEGDTYQAIELPYYTGQGSDSFMGELSMTILLPKAGEFESFESSLDMQLVDSIISDMETNQVVLTMPKFEFEFAFSLMKILSEMGMPIAFAWGDADFSGMTVEEQLFIRDVIHKAFVSVDEQGTEAAAASIAIVVAGSQPDPPNMTVDRPFIFLIRDHTTGSILFMGSVLNPVT